MKHTSSLGQPETSDWDIPENHAAGDRCRQHQPLGPPARAGARSLAARDEPGVTRDPPRTGPKRQPAGPNVLKRLARYAVTASYLRPQQIRYRLKSVLRQRLPSAVRGYGASYLRRAAAADHYHALEFPEVRGVSVDVPRLAAGEFTFLNHTVQLGRPVRWSPNDQVRLWLYNLHAWHYATGLGSAFTHEGDKQAYQVFRDLVREWITACPVATSPAWDAYPTSLRLANWIRAYSLFRPALEEDEALAAELRRSLYVQASFLEDHLEYDLLNNHLLENGRALLLAGLFFDGRDAQSWRSQGEKILWNGLENDFLSDGGHDERSPMYHQAMLELYDEIAAILRNNGHSPPQILAERLPQMRDWLGHVCHPDGQIALLNDAVFGVVRPAGETLDGTRQEKDGLHALPDSGYYTLRDREHRHYLIFDCGPLGPDHQPGHGHCDALSYELSVAGRRMVVDSGVSTYHGDLAWRTYYRSTRAHNTVVIDNAEQSEIWDRFRVARRAQVEHRSWSDRDPDLLYASGAHSGYRRLKGSVGHRRWVCWVAKRFWLICDYVDGRGPHRLESFLHFHPEVTVARYPIGPPHRSGGAVRREEVVLNIAFWGEHEVAAYHGALSPIQGWYAPEFGIDQKNHVWSQCFEGTLPAWMGYVLWPEEETPEVRWSPTGVGSCRITVRSGGDLYGICVQPEEVSLETAPDRRC